MAVNLQRPNSQLGAQEQLQGHDEEFQSPFELSFGYVFVADGLLAKANQLWSGERRLRHLRSIAARNIVSRNGFRLLDTYFTLHPCDTTRIYKEFYKSEVIKNSLNPTWRSLDFGLMPDRLDTSVSCFVVRIWGGKKEHFQLLIEWKVNLDGLKYLGQQIHARNPNEIIFGLHDGYYGASFEQKDHSGTLKNSLLQVDQSCVRNSYDVFSLLRLHRAQCAIKQTQVTVQRIGREIEEKLRCTSTRNELKKESECLQLKILVLRNELERQKKALGQEVALLQKQKSTLCDRENAFGTEYEKLGEHNESLCEFRKECTAKREQLLKTNAQQTIRCKQLLSELSYIYPIDLNDQKDYFVCGVKLPNSEDFQGTAVIVGQPESSEGVELGQLLLLGSARVRFPLYPKGGEKLQFEYGVYLLNKNIAQLRYQHGLSTPDLRQTLPNLKNFMEIGLMVRCDRHHTSSAIPVPKRQSSSFGRLHLGFSSGLPSPDKGPRKRASTGTDRLRDTTPPPSYTSALTQPVGVPARGGQLGHPPGPLSSSLDTSLDSSKGKGEDLCGSLDGDSGRCGALNGAAVPGTVPCCAVERAEEIMGTEATAAEQLEGFGSIPVEHAVAVECDEQVLGEFEEFSRRIYALNENVSSFRRPRKSSDK
ncbi:UV radiation resistance associated protein [Willisornis vidua]|uniref:UV radiation resistance associated protein n=1 Tax=Willisornis vidua TaxID=1566151 RepID=A0ABQ9DP87_9PASS|nr:UV radiation resistance associated protein [Willisornis vidua]